MQHTFPQFLVGPILLFLLGPGHVQGFSVQKLIDSRGISSPNSIQNRVTSIPLPVQKENEVEVTDETQSAFNVNVNVNGSAQPAEVESKNAVVEKEKILAEVTEKAQLSPEVDNEQAELDDKFMGMAIEMVLLA